MEKLDYAHEGASVATEARVNVAPSSDNGHYVKGAKQVVNLDEATEAFAVTGAATMETANHTTLNIEEDSIVSCQVMYNPLEKMFEKVRD